MCPTKTTKSSDGEYSDASSCDSDSNNVPYNNSTSFFEGVEKLLEVWFTTVDGEIDNCDLRRMPRYSSRVTLKIKDLEFHYINHITINIF